MPLIKSAQEIAKKKINESKSKKYDGDESEPRTLEMSRPDKKYDGDESEPRTLEMSRPETEQEKKQREDADEQEKKYGGSIKISKKRGYEYEAPGTPETKDGRPGRISKDDIIARPDILENMKEGAAEVMKGAATTSKKSVSEAAKKTWEEKQNEMKGLKDNFYYKKVGEGKVEKVQK